jgi:hypothetical protein
MYFFSLTRNLMLTSRSLLQSDIFWRRIRTHLYLKIRPLVLSKAIKLSLVRLWQVRTCSIVACLSLPSHSCFPSYRVSLVFFVSYQVYIVTSKTWSTDSCVVSSIFVSWRIVSTQCLKVTQQRASSKGIMRALLFDLSSVSLTHK